MERPSSSSLYLFCTAPNLIADDILGGNSRSYRASYHIEIHFLYLNLGGTNPVFLV